MDNPYLRLTAEFNGGRLRALLSSDQAVVVHRLALASKDGDWILREDAEAAGHVLGTLADRGARYRFGAPLDPRWLAGGWSSHLEYRADGLRYRTDFVSRPPRIPPATLAEMWAGAERSGSDVVALEPLAAIKLTDREKDYAVVGEIARHIVDVAARFRYSRSSRDLLELAALHPDALAAATRERPLLAAVAHGRDALDEALDRERRALMRANEARLDRYREASRAWAAAWPDVQREIRDLPLSEAHEVVCVRALGLLPCAPPEPAP